MKTPSAAALLAFASQAVAGPYPAAAGKPGSTAIHRSDSRFTLWADRVTSYRVGTDCLTKWQDTSKALGSATEDPADITCLGAGGTITLAFPAYIKDGPGADFAIFENSFLDEYIEHAWVEVSRDGINFLRFPNHSLTTAPVGSFDLMDPTNVSGLGCKYRQPFGEPYDLADVGLDSVSHVRLVDIVGDGSARDSANRIIYDPFPNAQSAGFDLDAVGVIHSATWQTLDAGRFAADAINATAFAHLPDGRFILGAQGKLSQQTTWGWAGRSAMGGSGVEFDPSFIAVRRDNNSILVGAGGGFGGNTGIHLLHPGAPSPALSSAPLAALQNFAAVWWKSSNSPAEGWLVAGTNGPTGRNNITYISPNGLLTGPVTSELSTYSGGLATDPSGNVYVGLFEFSGPKANLVISFHGHDIDRAVTAIPSGNNSPLLYSTASPVFKFVSASSVAMDSLGRLWATGPQTQQIQGFDPATGASLLITPDHAPLTSVTDPIYLLQAFSKEETGYLAFLAQDEAGTPGTPILHGIAPLNHLIIPETLTSWQAFQFRGSNPNAANEGTLWGSEADPDSDGLSNLMEYALSTPPLSANALPLSVGESSQRLTLTFPRNPLRRDLRYTVEASFSLAADSWSPLASGAAGGPLSAVSPALPLITETPSGKTIRVSVRDTLVQTAQAKRFLRLRVTLQP